MITSYTFGKMGLRSRTFTRDLIILPDKEVQENWRRTSGHLLVLEDLSSILAETPDLIIVGTGAHGRMKLSSDLKPDLENLGIEIRALPTPEAVTLYNELNRQTSPLRISACFHLTC